MSNVSNSLRQKCTTTNIKLQYGNSITLQLWLYSENRKRCPENSPLVNPPRWISTWVRVRVRLGGIWSGVGGIDQGGIFLVPWKQLLLEFIKYHVNNTNRYMKILNLYFLHTYIEKIWSTASHTNSEPYQTYQMKLFAKMVHGCKPRYLILQKAPILYVWEQSTENTLLPFLFRSSSESSRPATFLKVRPWHRCFPVNFAKYL